MLTPPAYICSPQRSAADPTAALRCRALNGRKQQPLRALIHGDFRGGSAPASPSLRAFAIRTGAPRSGTASPHSRGAGTPASAPVPAPPRALTGMGTARRWGGEQTTTPAALDGWEARAGGPRGRSALLPSPHSAARPAGPPTPRLCGRPGASGPAAHYLLPQLCGAAPPPPGIGSLGGRPAQPPRCPPRQ